MQKDDVATGPARNIYKVTYTPVSLATNGNRNGSDNGALLVRGSFLNLLNVVPAETGQMNLTAAERESADALVQHAAAASESDYSASLQRLSQVPKRNLQMVVEKLAELRDSRASALTAAVADIDAQYQRSPNQQRTAVSNASSAQVAASSSATAAVSPRSTTATAFPPTHVTSGPLRIERPAQPSPKPVKTQVLPALVQQKLGTGVASRLNVSLPWAAAHIASQVASLTQNFSIDAPGPAGLPNAISAKLLDYIQSAIVANRVKEIVSAELFDLVGLLHLERMVMTPLAAERGELLYSLPLSPEETVTLAHKEWTIVEEDFSRYIQDYLENYSETGVAQSQELSTTTDTQLRRQDATSANLSSMSNQGVTATAPITSSGSTSTVDASSSTQQSVAQMREVTSKASTRTIRDQKTSFTVTTTKGSEDWTARLLKNPHKDKSMMVDYYRRVRRWRTDLYRYGVRLTYDIVVPHPGRRLWNIYQQVTAMQKQLAQGFQMPVAVSAITPATRASLESMYQVALPMPPDNQSIDTSRTVNYPAAADHSEDLQLSVPTNYQIQTLSFQLDTGVYDTGERGAVMLIGPNVWNYMNTTQTHLDTGTVAVPLTDIPLQGPVNATVLARHLGWGTIRIFASVMPTDQALNTWRQTCWGILREAALARFQQQQDQLRTALSALQKSIAAADTLSLRRIEREYIMLTCLDWLFPFLNLQSGWFSGLNDTPTSLDRVAGFQESVLIKLMHTAIDWDSMLITLLPFFWERIDSQARVFVDHPDPLHREFLRAGAARLILPILPGYEDQIMSLFDLGYAGADSGINRYQKIIDDVRAANAAFDALSNPASATGPDGTILPGYLQDLPLQTGKLIGRWHDIMPTSALDMDVTFEAVKGA